MVAEDTPPKPDPPARPARTLAFAMARLAKPIAAALVLVFAGLAAAWAARSVLGANAHESVRITMAEAPPAVRATLQAELGPSGTLDRLEQQTAISAGRTGKVTYFADLTIAGQSWDLVLDADGKVNSRERD